jgi:hypothetical protein
MRDGCNVIVSSSGPDHYIGNTGQHVRVMPPADNHDMERQSQRKDEISAPELAAEDLLDLAIELTFPASDPISVVQAFRAANARDRET